MVRATVLCQCASVGERLIENTCSVRVRLLNQSPSMETKREMAGSRCGERSTTAHSPNAVSTSGGSDLAITLRSVRAGVFGAGWAASGARLTAGALLIEAASAESADAIERELARTGMGGDASDGRTPTCTGKRAVPKEKGAAGVFEADARTTDAGILARGSALKLSQSGYWPSCSSAQLTTTRAPMTVASTNRGRRELASYGSALGTAASPETWRA
mmetsp:Transcript_36591/g.117489  ORF Transcript_36591/g.117489 Transcript_36591/m.117489 type:complete len:217 (-) Transcript_36591:385-1035(-)|eukprot:scaffold7602_cov123-Isochrysis_galbana.AAC.9